MSRPVNSDDAIITPPPPPTLHEAVEECFTLATQKQAFATATPRDESIPAREDCTLDQRLADVTRHVDDLIEQLSEDKRTARVYEELPFEGCE